MARQSDSTFNGSRIEILRQRYFIDHSFNAKTFFTEEYTLVSNHNNISNIILQVTNFLPNLTVHDSDGEELPIMSNLHTKTLIKSEISNSNNANDKEFLNKLLELVSTQKIFVIWIKLPPLKILAKNQVKIINLKYSASKENRKENEITLKIPSNENRVIFYTIKQPADYDFGRQNIFIKNEQGQNIKNWRKNKQNYFYMNRTQDSHYHYSKIEHSKSN